MPATVGQNVQIKQGLLARALGYILGLQCYVHVPPFTLLYNIWHISLMVLSGVCL